MSDLFCQNKRCVNKKLNSQIRGNKGYKYYQSNKATEYFTYWCSTGCRVSWLIQNEITIMNIVGIIDKQIIPSENAWEFSSEYNDDSRYDYYLINRLMGIKQPVTRQQAQTTEQLRDDYSNYATRSNSDANLLANELGLSS